MALVSFNGSSISKGNKYLSLNAAAVAGGVVEVKATGGSESTVGGFRLHTFTSSGTLTVNKRIFVQYFLISGGGGAGCNWRDFYNSIPSSGSFGGAGGGKYLSGSISLDPGQYAVTVGAGGAGGTIPPGAPGTFPSLPAAAGGNGGTSSFGPSISITGGSGTVPGGARFVPGGTGVLPGGSSPYNGVTGGGGGGIMGAGVNGFAGPAPGYFLGGEGGAGGFVDWPGSQYNFGGGGGGSSRSTFAPAGPHPNARAAGGNGGGGAGGFWALTPTTPVQGAGIPGDANRGGGGGGHFTAGFGGILAGRNGGDGGSGLVLLRYQL